MSRVEFRIVQSGKLYAVDMYRDGERYVVFVDGLSKEAAEREAQRLTDFFQRISSVKTLDAPKDECSP